MRTSIVLQFAVLIAFITAGVLSIPLLGFEDDELIFVNLFFHPDDSFSRLPLFSGYAIPVMAASYAGALKTWLYSPLLLLGSPSVWVIRLPAVILAAVTIALTARLMTRIACPIAGMLITCLLATDATFLLTATFDWGPVVLQHLLLVISLLSLTEWYQRPNSRLLFAGGVTIGLALWDKSLFLWQLSGWILALLLIAFPVVLKAWSRNNLWTLTRGLLLGALPLIGANFRHHFATLRDNGHMNGSELGMKGAFLRSAFDGQAATTFLIDSANGVDRIQRPFESFALALTHWLGNSPSLWRFYPALVIILVAARLAKGAQQKWILFFLTSGCIGWLQSALTLHAGNVVHHAVLFWISWYGALSLSLTMMLRSSLFYLRLTASLLVAAFCVRGLLVMGASYGSLIAHPGSPRWTNADSALTTHLLSSGVKRIIVADWGIKNIVVARSANRIDVDSQAAALNLGVFNQNAFESCAAQDCVVVTRVPGRSVFSAAPAILDRAFLETGLGKAGQTTIPDTHGVPAFEFFRIDRVKPLLNTFVHEGVAGEASISAHPKNSMSGTPQVQLIWSVGMGVDAEVHKDGPKGPLIAAGTGPGSAIVDGVRGGTEFFLQDVTGGKPLSSAHTLAQVRVQVSSAGTEPHPR